MPAGDNMLAGWTARSLPPNTGAAGVHCRLEPLDPDTHGPELAAALLASNPATWDYLPYGPFADIAAIRNWLGTIAGKPDPQFHTVIDTSTGRPLGMLSLMRVDAANGVIEVGHVHFSDTLKRTPAATEAVYLLMSRVFDDLGYRRFEWKCNALNEASRKAALRLGFTYEGTFRQASVVKGRNRDTAWFSMLDKEWPDRKRALQAWLAPDNFDDAGRQRVSLSSLMV